MTMQKTDQDWRQTLTSDQYAVMRCGATEVPFTGALLHNKQTGTYTCVACNAELFDSKTKFDSGSGWPSFYDAKPGAVEFRPDNSHDMRRTEIVCANCGGHLGHVFDDAYNTPTQQRYCVNSVALNFTPRKSE